MTPADQVQKPTQLPPPPPAVMSLLGPLLFQFLGPQGSLRRLLFALPGVVLLLLNHRIGLNLSLEEQGIAATLILGVVTASNTKEAAVTRAQIAGQAAVQVALHQANATIAAAQAGADSEPEKEG